MLQYLTYMGYPELERSQQAQREKERAALGETFQRKGIRVVVFDADNTLLKTNDVYRAAFADVYQTLSTTGTSPYREAGDFLAQVRAFEDEFYGMMGRLQEEFRVNPVMFTLLVGEMTRRFGQFHNETLAAQVQNRLDQIYTRDRYVPFPGAHETADDFAAVAEQTYVMTHAGLEHSRRKFGTAGLLNSFTGGIVAMDVGRKKRDQCPEQFAYYRIEPEEALVVGDNLAEDIVGPLQMGAHAVWLTHDKPLTPQKTRLLEMIEPQSRRLYQTGFIHTVIPTLLARG